MDKTARFWNRMAERYSRQPIADEEAYQRKLELTRKYLTGDTELLEFGCGTGSTALIHAPRVKHIRALDVSDKMLEIAKSKARNADIANVSFEQGKIDDTALPADHYDVVMGMSILHLLEDKQAVINKVFSTLKPGGVFVSSTVCLQGKIRFFKPVFTVGRWLSLLPKVNMFSQSELKASMSQAGFDTLEEFSRPGGSVCFLIVQKPMAG